MNSQDKNENKKARIPETPEQRFPRAQSNEERKRRLAEWKELLNSLPKCAVVKAGDEIYNTYVSDNFDDFKDSLIVVKVEPDIKEVTEEGPFMVLYFHFNSDGKTVTISSDGDVEDYPWLDDPVADKCLAYLEGHQDKVSTSWKEGYDELADLLENSLDMPIPPTPGKE